MAGSKSDTMTSAVLSFALWISVVWEGRETYASLDEALQAAEEGLAAWMSEQFGTA
jgi:hypothetical protein